MKKPRLIDWQENLLKKDVEEIIKKMNFQKAVSYSIGWDFLILCISLAVSNFFPFRDEKCKIWFLAVEIIILAIPFLFIGIKEMIRKFYVFIGKVLKVKSGDLLIKSYIDLFDNKICYFVLMSSSYYEFILAEDDLDEKILLFQELCYYQNKSIDMLYSINPIIDKVFYSDYSRKQNKVGLHRLIAVEKIIEKNSRKIEELSECFQDDCRIQMQVEENKRYLYYFDDFKKTIKKYFGNY